MPQAGARHVGCSCCYPPQAAALRTMRAHPRSRCFAGNPASHASQQAATPSRHVHALRPVPAPTCAADQQLHQRGVQHGRVAARLVRRAGQALQARRHPQLAALLGGGALGAVAHRHKLARHPAAAGRGQRRRGGSRAHHWHCVKQTLWNLLVCAWQQTVWDLLLCYRPSPLSGDQRRHAPPCGMRPPRPRTCSCPPSAASPARGAPCAPPGRSRGPPRSAAECGRSRRQRPPCTPQG